MLAQDSGPIRVSYAPGALSVKNVGKSYSTYATEWDRVAGWFGLMLRPKHQTEVLKGISFDVASGEAIGIIGQNGSGKSTLLKIITGSLAASTGSVEKHGRVAAMLELGLGFNPDFTGRQNALNYLAMIGCPHQEMMGLLLSVESFAEVGEYFDQPVRTYSSGMQMRVAFASATALRPDVLIVDEALAVGDSYFVHKCMARIREFCALGTTLLLVSHDPSSVRSLCDRAILLDKGRLIVDGAPDEVCDRYNALIAARESAAFTLEQRRNSRGWLHTVSGSGGARVTDVKLRDSSTHQNVKLCATGQSLEFVLTIDVLEPLSELVVGMMLRDKAGHVVWGSNTWHTKQVLHDVPVGSITVEASFLCNLGLGSYGITTALHAGDVHTAGNHEWQDNALVFDVVDTGAIPVFIGSTYLPVNFKFA